MSEHTAAEIRDPAQHKPPKAGRVSLGFAGGLVRIVMIVPVIATMIAAIALIVYGAIETRHFISALFSTDHAISRDEALLLAIEIVDLFLLATVVQVVSLGLYQLYFRQDLALPNWLKINDLDDLKSKLVGVVVTVMAVFFLGKAITWTGAPDIMYLGVGVGAVILSLTWFLKNIGH